MKTALIQINPTVGAVDENAERIRRGVLAGVEQGAELCLTPELALIGYPPRDMLLNRAVTDRCARALDKLAKELPPEAGVLVGAPSQAAGAGGNPLYNSAWFCTGGKVVSCFSKHLLPTYDVFDERRYFEPSSALNILEFRGKRIGVTICEDVWGDCDVGPCSLYSEDPLAALAAAGVDMVVNLSASPFTLGKQHLREKMLSGLARKYGFPFLYANQTGGNDDLVFDGRSMGFDAEGGLLVRGAGFAEDVVIVDTKAGNGTPVADEDSFSREEEAWNALVLGTRDYVRKCGFDSTILGLSGGIDSSLTAAVAVEALGKDKVRGVLMPSPHSSRGSIDDSLALAAGLGIRTETVPIGPLMDAFDTALAPAFEGRSGDVTEENVQARIRGNLLMAMSNKFGSMLLTTGNKTELAVGYCTIYGDMSGGLAVISDVPKMLVYSVCSWLNETRGREIVPVAVIEKPPSAELRPDQKDEDSLPPYEVLDGILELLIEKRMSLKEVADAGFDPEVAAEVARLVGIAEFKRSQAAPGIRITDRAFGTGWRMPIAKRNPF